MSSNKEKIIEAAEKLEAQGVNPTQVTVREALGGGSFATIGPVLKEWKESKKEDRALAEIQVPESITDRLEQLQGAVWQAAVDEADRRLIVEREALKAAQDAAAAEVAEQLESVAALEAEADKYNETIEGLLADVDARTAQLNILLADFKQAKEQTEADRQAGASALAKEQGSLKAAIERAERAETLHEAAQTQARADLADLKKEHKTDMATLKKEVKAAAADEIKQVESRAQEQAHRADKAEKETQLRAAGESACQSRLEAAQREAEQMVKRVEKLEAKAEKAAAEAAELRGELKALKAINETASEPEKQG